MRKLNFVAVMAFIVLAFSACDKDVESTALTLKSLDSAKVLLHVYADLDLTDEGLEVVPEGTVMSVKINNSEFRSGAAGAFIQSVTVGANGEITISVPVDQNGVSATITPLPFEYSQVQEFNDYITSITKYYTAGAETISLYSGQTIVKEITYTANTYGDYTDITLISGSLLADLNDTIVGSEDVTSNVDLIFHFTGWSTNVTATNGQYSVEVPTNEIIYVTGMFQASNYIDTVGMVTYEYEVEALSIGSFASETEDVDIDFGAGTEVE